MFRAFAITTSTPSIRLNGMRDGALTFTVTNALGRPVRGRAVVEPEGATPRDWLLLEGAAERDFPRDGTHQYTVRVDAPSGARQGQYAFHLSVVNVANPDEEFTVGPSASIHVPPPQTPAPKKKFPWAWLALAAGILVISLGTFFALRGEAEQTPEPAKQTFLRFDANESYVELGNPKALRIEGPITLEAWIRPRALNGFRNIVDHGPIYSFPLAQVYFRIRDGQYNVGSWNGRVDFATSADIPSTDVGRWVYLAGVYDGARWSLYRDGELLSSTPQPTGALPVEGPWSIGARFFLGDIREVRIWNIARGPEEIRADMTRTFTGKEPGLVGYWPLNEGQDVVARDATPNENHGIIRGATWDSE